MRWRISPKLVFSSWDTTYAELRLNRTLNIFLMVVECMGLKYKNYE